MEDGMRDQIEHSEINPLLDQWEETYKKGLLSFWILLLLSQREVYAYEMKPAIEALSQETITVDENSLYRALRRFTDAGLVESQMHSSEIGPPRRYFHLTHTGSDLLGEFIRRNLLIFQTKEFRNAIDDFVSPVQEEPDGNARRDV